MATYIATTVVGLEAIASRELEADFGLRPRASVQGAVLFDGPDGPSAASFELLATLNQWARGLDRVGILLAGAQSGRLDDFYDLTRNAEVGRFIRPQQTFAVRSHRSGRHSYGSPDVARVVGQAVIDGYRESAGARLAVSLDDPDVMFRAEVIGDTFRLWLDATGDRPLFRRGYRRQGHPAALRASLAHLMLRLLEWKGQPLLDPMSGIGTIPIEAAMYARGVAPSRFRSWSPILQRYRRSGGDALCGEGEAPSDPAPRPGLARSTFREPLAQPRARIDILGIERYPRHVDGAALNLAAIGAPAGVRCVVGDAGALEAVIDRVGRYPLAAVNPPFGRRVGSTGMIGRLYRDMAGSMAAVGVERLVALAEDRRRMVDALDRAGYRVVRAIRLLYGDLPAHVVLADRSRSSAAGADTPASLEPSEAP